MSCQHKAQAMDTKTGIVTCENCQDLIGLIPQKPLLANNGSKEPLERAGVEQMIRKVYSTLTLEESRTLAEAGELPLLDTLRLKIKATM